MWSQRKAAVWGPSIGQEGLMTCCRVTVQSRCLALPTSVGCWPIPSAFTCTARPILEALVAFERSSSENTVKTPVYLEEGVERNEMKAVFAMNHSQKMVYCRDIYESEGRMRSTRMSPPDLLTGVVQGKNQREKILHFCWKICQHPLGNSKCPLIITAKTQCFQDLQVSI